MLLNTKGPTFRNFPRSDLAVKKTVRGSVPSIPFESIARSVLGTRYELSLVICGDQLAANMNRRYRKKHYAANVLSFPLDKQEGEIFLNINAAKREATHYGASLRARLVLLFVHGCLHLKGLPHGKTMDRETEKMLKKFG